jgi:hypothetical protein
MSGAAVAYCTAGGLVLYSGIKGATIADTVKAALAGNLTVTGTEAITAPAPGGQESIANSGGVPSGSAAKAQAYAKSQMSKYGWTDADFSNYLVPLWNRESGWSSTADTRVTHAGGDGPGSAVFAYGIAQARPYSKYPQAGWPPDKGGQADAQTQIDWGLQYIHDTYQGSLALAWGHEQQNGWY